MFKNSHLNAYILLVNFEELINIMRKNKRVGEISGCFCENLLRFNLWKIRGKWSKVMFLSTLLTCFLVQWMHVRQMKRSTRTYQEHAFISPDLWQPWMINGWNLIVSSHPPIPNNTIHVKLEGSPQFRYRICFDMLQLLCTLITTNWTWGGLKKVNHHHHHHHQCKP